MTNETDRKKARKLMTRAELMPPETSAMQRSGRQKPWRGRERHRRDTFRNVNFHPDNQTRHSILEPVQGTLFRTVRVAKEYGDGDGSPRFHPQHHRPVS